MRYDADHKRRTRDKVIGIAAKAIRAHGPDGVGVAGIMAQAGLTHGGFYAHFASKDALIAAAIERMFLEAGKRLAQAREGHGAAAALAAYVDFYLSRAHRDARRDGCPVAALASDLPRMPLKARRAFADGQAHALIELSGLFERLGAEVPERAAQSMFTEMLGALSLARIEPDAARSDAILAHARAAIHARFGLPRPA